MGNGASLVMWNQFKYGSLFETARTTNRSNQLSEIDLAIFKALGTENFETALDALSTTQTMNRIIGCDASQLPAYYTNIQNALFEAVYYVHPPDELKDHNIRTLRVLREVLLNYESVFSTNYDLLAYWAIMSKHEGAGFKDYFWNPGLYFDPTNVDIVNRATRVLYLHGGIHLARLANNRTLKRACSYEGGTLQQSLWTPRSDGAIPLFITEGKSRDKEAAIHRSEYLSFAMDEFKKHKKPLVVFGHSLGESDNHLADAIQQWGEVPIAISMRPDSVRGVWQKKANMQARFPHAELYFFDSTSHPMGADNLKLSTKYETNRLDRFFTTANRLFDVDEQRAS